MKEKKGDLDPIEFFEKNQKFNYCYLANRHQSKSELNKFYPDVDRGVVKMYYKQDIDSLMKWVKEYYSDDLKDGGQTDAV